MARKLKVYLPFRAHAWVRVSGYVAMKYTDIAIIGGGLAGSTAAAMLGRAGISAVLIDPHPLYPPDFRVEKLSGGEQLDRFAKTGIADSVLRSATHDGENWIARSGHLLDKRPSQQFGLMYDSLVNTIRAQIPPDVERIHAKVIGIANSADRQKLTLSNDEMISARLVVLANGLNIGLRRSLGIERQIVSPCHSISIGFDIAPVDRAGLRLSRADLFLGADQRPDSLYLAVSRRRADAGQSVRLSRSRRSLDQAVSHARRSRH